MTKTPKQLLESAFALLKDGDAWTQKGFARNKQGRVVPSFSPNAVCFCSDGALMRADMNDFTDRLSDTYWRAYYLFAEAARERGFAGPVEANDSLDWPEVKEIWLEAIASA